MAPFYREVTEVLRSASKNTTTGGEHHRVVVVIVLVSSFYGKWNDQLPWYNRKT